jgi:hypothetical protein
MTIGPIGGIKRRQVHLRHRVDHKPRQMIGRQPLPHIRRQQESLLTPIFDEVLRHAGIPITGADRPLRDSLDDARESGRPIDSRLLLAAEARAAGSPS